MDERLLPPINLPVLSLPDHVVLPGMVVPVALDEPARAAVDAARAAADAAAARPPACRPLPGLRGHRLDRAGRPAARGVAAVVGGE